MQRILFGFLLAAALYVSGLAYATDEPPVAETGAPEPHIALLLPLKSEAFGRAAEAVQQGFMAAANNQPLPFPIRVYGCTEESKEINALYQQAIENGARSVAGPLTRDGMAALSANSRIAVPTLVLNTGEAKGVDNLYFLGLSAEAEARHAAKLASAASLSGAIVVSDGTPLSTRLSQAFMDEWRNLGGSLVAKILYNDDPKVLADIPDEPGSMIFLAADVKTARMIHPYLNIALPVYATSQLFNGDADTLTNYDLNNTRFVDMPWLLQNDHPAVMIYPRASPPLETGMERLYALGIDAFRLLQIMLDNAYSTTLPLDGVTGLIRLNGNHQFQREAVPALIKQGRSQLLEAPISTSAPPRP